VRVWGKFDNSNLPYSAKEDWTIQICHTALNTQSFYLGNITIQDYTTSLSIVAIYTQEWRSCFRYCARRYGSSSVELLCVKWFGNAHTASTTSLARNNGICSSVSTLRRARCQKLTLWPFLTSYNSKQVTLYNLRLNICLLCDECYPHRTSFRANN